MFLLSESFPDIRLINFYSIHRLYWTL